MSNSNMFEHIIQKKKDKESINRCLLRYIEQLKIHFNVSDNDINDIIKNILKSRANKTIWDLFKYKKV